MIELDLLELSVVVMIGTLVCFFGLKWIEAYRERRERRQACRRRRECRLCLAIFESQTHERIQHCPECGGVTESKGPRPLG